MFTLTHRFGVFGMSVQAVSENLSDHLTSENPALSLTAQGGEVAVECTATAKTETEATALLQPLLAVVRERLGAFVYGENVPSLQHRVVQLLKEKSLKIATAESCTAGILSGKLTEVAGVSDVFECGVAAYSNEIKHSVLGVPEVALVLHGAVSKEVAAAMATGTRRISEATIGIGITGVAGPDPSEGKPVGTVYIALADKKRVWVKKIEEQGADREAVRLCATLHALDLSRRYLEALPAVMAGAELLTPPSSEQLTLPSATAPRPTLWDFLSFRRVKGKAALFRRIAVWSLLLALLVGGGLYTYNYVYRPLHNEQIYKNLELDYYAALTGTPPSVNTSSYPDDMLAQFYTLYDQNPDIRGWLKLDGTAISYPVMDGRNVDYYATHDFSGADSAFGTPYFDDGADFSSADAQNRVLVIYGNRTDSGQMFAPLTQYADASFYARHEFFSMNTLYENARFQVCAVMQVDAADNNAEFDYTKHHFEGDEHAAFLEQIAARSLFELPVTLTAKDSLLLLSVDYPTEGFATQRLVIVARKLGAGMTEQPFPVVENEDVLLPAILTGGMTAQRPTLRSTTTKPTTTASVPTTEKTTTTQRTEDTEYTTTAEKITTTTTAEVTTTLAPTTTTQATSAQATTTTTTLAPTTTTTTTTTTTEGSVEFAATTTTSTAPAPVE